MNDPAEAHSGFTSPSPPAERTNDQPAGRTNDQPAERTPARSTERPPARSTERPPARSTERPPIAHDDPDAEILTEAGPGMPPWSGPAPRIDVLFLDEHMVCVSKPPGLLVHRVAGSDERVVLLQTVRDQVGRRLFPVQRLDRPASGLIVFGLTSNATAALQENLHHEDSRKEYTLLVRGDCPDRFESRRPLKGPSGALQDAWSEFETLERRAGLSLVRGRLRTGRTHQLRRHLAHLGHPVVGDTSYGRVQLDAALRDAHGLARLFLHASRLVTRHPIHGAPLDLRAPLFPDLVATLLSLGFTLPIPGPAPGAASPTRDTDDASPASPS